MSHSETNFDPIAILDRHRQEAEHNQTVMAKPEFTKLLEFYRSRMIAHGYDQREAEAHETIAAWCAYRFMGEAKRGLLLFGTNGNGKTLGAQEISRFFATKFLWSPAIVEYWLHDEETPWLERCAPTPAASDKPYPNCDIIIDELGKDLADGIPVKYGHKFNPLAHLLAIRYDQWRQTKALTVITTNCDDAEMERLYGKHIVDRLHEMVRRIDFTGVSRRSEWKVKA